MPRPARRRPHVVPLVLIAVAATTLPACTSSGSGGAGSDGTASSSAVSSPTGASSPTSPAATSTIPASASGTATSRVTLILEPDGLGALTGEASIRHLTFGTDLGVVRTALTAALGPLTASTQSECGQGARLQLARQGFTALFAGNRFVGWFDDGRGGAHLTTADGLGVGSTLAAVRRARADVTVSTGTLGPEWTTPGGLGGLLDGTAGTSKVTGIYAGETCFFR